MFSSAYEHAITSPTQKSKQYFLLTTLYSANLCSIFWLSFAVKLKTCPVLLTLIVRLNSNFPKSYGQFFDFILLDLSAEFDTIDHFLFFCRFSLPCFQDTILLVFFPSLVVTSPNPVLGSPFLLNLLS